MEIKPPTPIDHLSRRRYTLVVFLAGSIEQGRAALWHKDVIVGAGEAGPDGGEVLYLNPRRDQWDPTWVQSIDNPQFRGQVEWEIAGIEYADIIFFYFQPDTQAPITLHELGLALASGKRCIVVCPPGFWRKGNVDISCDHYGVKVYDTIEAGIEELKLACYGD